MNKASRERWDPKAFRGTGAVRGPRGNRGFKVLREKRATPVKKENRVSRDSG